MQLIKSGVYQYIGCSGINQIRAPFQVLLHLITKNLPR